MLSRIFKAAVGILFFPVSYAATAAFIQQIKSIESFNSLHYYFLYGAGAYALIHLVLFKPNYLYVLGHESTHALAALLCGGRIGSFRISSEGGSVETSKSNFFIALAPYFISAYTLLAALLYGGLSLFFHVQQHLRVFMFVVGLTLAFHFVMTIEMIKKKQSDLMKTGFLFSVNLVYLVNISLLLLILAAMFSEVSAALYFKDAYSISRDFYIFLFSHLF